MSCYLISEKFKDKINSFFENSSQKLYQQHINLCKIKIQCKS